MDNNASNITSRASSVHRVGRTAVGGVAISSHSSSSSLDDADEDGDGDDSDDPYRLHSSFTHSSKARVERIAASLHRETAGKAIDGEENDEVRPYTTSHPAPLTVAASESSAPAAPAHQPVDKLRIERSWNTSATNSMANATQAISAARQAIGRLSPAPSTRSYATSSPSASAALNFPLSPARSVSGSALPMSPGRSSSALSLLSRSSDRDAHTSVLSLQKQLAEQELATVEERNKRIALQTQLDLYRKEPSTAPAAQQTTQPSVEAISKTTFFKHMKSDQIDKPEKCDSFPSLDSNPDLVQWNQHLRNSLDASQRKISSLESLIEEQSREMSKLRTEKNDLSLSYDSLMTNTTTRITSLETQLGHCSDQSHSDRMRHLADTEKLHRLENELVMLEERARQDVESLLRKVTSLTNENSSLRQVYVQEKERLKDCQSNLRQTQEDLQTIREQYEHTSSSSKRYKEKSREVLEHLRKNESIRETQGGKLRNLTIEYQRTRDRCLEWKESYEILSKDFGQLSEQHNDLRKELLGKTSELTEIYETFSKTVEKYGHEKRFWIERFEQQERQHSSELNEQDVRHQDTLKHHQLITHISAPITLSTQMHMDLHKNLSDKQTEILKLSSELHHARTEVLALRNLATTSTMASAAAATSSSLSSSSTTNIDTATFGALQHELSQLRYRLECRTEENHILQEKMIELEGHLQYEQRKNEKRKNGSNHMTGGGGGGVGVDSIQHYQPPQQPQQQHSSVSQPHQPSTTSNPNTAHLYQQIVELHETLSNLQRTSSDKDVELDQLRTSLSVSISTRRSLEEQLQLVQTHLSEFQTKDLPTPYEFQIRLEQQRQQWQQQMKELRQQEEDWRIQVQKEREEFMKKQATEESFVAKAIAIHTDELASEVDSLSALMSSRQTGLEPGIEHLVPKPTIQDSNLTLPQTEEVLQKTVSDLRSLRRYIADEYAKGLSNECIMQ